MTGINLDAQNVTYGMDWKPLDIEYGPSSHQKIDGPWNVVDNIVWDSVAQAWFVEEPKKYVTIRME